MGAVDDERWVGTERLLGGAGAAPLDALYFDGEEDGGESYCLVAYIDDVDSTWASLAPEMETALDLVQLDWAQVGWTGPAELERSIREGRSRDGPASAPALPSGSSS